MLSCLSYHLILIGQSLDDDETDVFEDLQESRELEFQDFTPAPRLTEADKTCDMKSLNRKLDRVLYLIVKKPRQEHAWQMPQGGVEGEESLIQVCSGASLQGTSWSLVERLSSYLCSEAVLYNLSFVQRLSSTICPFSLCLGCQKGI